MKQVDKQEEITAEPTLAKLTGKLAEQQAAEHKPEKAKNKPVMDKTSTKQPVDEQAEPAAKPATQYEKPGPGTAPSTRSIPEGGQPPKGTLATNKKRELPRDTTSDQGAATKARRITVHQL